MAWAVTCWSSPPTPNLPGTQHLPLHLRAYSALASCWAYMPMIWKQEVSKVHPIMLRTLGLYSIPLMIISSNGAEQWHQKYYTWKMIQNGDDSLQNHASSYLCCFTWLIISFHCYCNAFAFLVQKMTQSQWGTPVLSEIMNESMNKWGEHNSSFPLVAVSMKLRELLGLLPVWAD